jgi:hypothetical protein
MEVAEIESLANANFREKPVLVKICVNFLTNNPLELSPPEKPHLRTTTRRQRRLLRRTHRFWS